MNDDFRFILEEALQAPSGDNSQPWHWVVDGNTLELWSRFSDEPIHSLYSNSINSGCSAYLAHGTAIENVCCAASVRKYRAEINYFPRSDEPTLVARITLAPDPEIQPDPLAKAIDTRMTSRLPFHTKPLSADVCAKLEAAGTDPELGEVRLTTDRSQIRTIARISSLQDELTFSCEDLHDYVLANVNWTKRQDDQRKTGFYFPTLGIPLFAWPVMQLLRNWWITSLGNYVGLHKFIALWQRWVYRRAGAYMMFAIRKDTPEDWVRVGRLVERVWLAATLAGISVHPLNGVVFLSIGAETPVGKQALSLSQRQRLESGRDALRTLFSFDGTILAFMFRLGVAHPPRARASRRQFDHMVEVHTPRA